MTTTQQTAIDGIRVLEWAAFLNGPSTGVMLAELGAEVIKIEEPIRGDPGRGVQALFGRSAVAGDVAIAFEMGNYGKKSITLDISKEQGRAVLYRLVKRSDVFITNYNKDLASKLGVDYEILRKHNPKIIYASTSGFGSKGPDAGKRAFDFVGQARSGMMTLMGESGTSPALMVGAPTDQLGSTMLALGISVALVTRERSGIGQEVETSMLGAAIHMQRLAVAMCSLREQELKRHSQKNTRSPFSNYYQCSDGKWIMLSEPQVDRFWHKICQVFSLEELEFDPRFSSMTARRDNAGVLVSTLCQVFTTKTSEEWLKTLGQEIGLACSPVVSISDLLVDPQVLENKYIIQKEHPALGRIKMPALPLSFSETPPIAGAPAPQMGQHTEEVLIEVGGYSWEDIASLREQGAI